MTRVDNCQPYRGFSSPPPSSPLHVLKDQTGQKKSNRCPMCFNIQNCPLAGHLFWRCCFEVNAFQWTQHSGWAGLQNQSPGKQSVSKDISCHPAHSRGFYQSVCAFVLTFTRRHVPVCHSCISEQDEWHIGLVLADGHIMRQRLHCWHQMTL